MLETQRAWWKPKLDSLGARLFRLALRYTLLPPQYTSLSRCGTPHSATFRHSPCTLPPPFPVPHPLHSPALYFPQLNRAPLHRPPIPTHIIKLILIPAQHRLVRRSLQPSGRHRLHPLWRSGIRFTLLVKSRIPIYAEHVLGRVGVLDRKRRTALGEHVERGPK